MKWKIVWVVIKSNAIEISKPNVFTSKERAYAYLRQLDDIRTMNNLTGTVNLSITSHKINITK